MDVGLIKSEVKEEDSAVELVEIATEPLVDVTDDDIVPENED